MKEEVSVGEEEEVEDSVVVVEAEEALDRETMTVSVIIMIPYGSYSTVHVLYVLICVYLCMYMCIVTRSSGCSSNNLALKVYLVALCYQHCSCLSTMVLFAECCVNMFLIIIFVRRFE